MTSSEVARVARAIHRAWRLPAAVEVEDIEQELRLQYVLGGRAYDASRGVPREAFCWWYARRQAERWCHTQRSALRRSGRAPSRLPVLLDDAIDPGVEPCAERVAELASAVRRARRLCRSAVDARALEALEASALDTSAAVESLAGELTRRQARAAMGRVTRALRAAA